MHWMLEIKKMDKDIDRAIWKGIANNDSEEVSKLLSKQHELIMKVLWGDNKSGSNYTITSQTTFCYSRISSTIKFCT